MRCKACDAPFTPSMIETSEKARAADPGLPEHVEEFVCSRCRGKAFENMPQDYYESLYWDKHAHPCHRVISPIIVELEEAHAERLHKTASHN